MCSSALLRPPLASALFEHGPSAWNALGPRGRPLGPVPRDGCWVGCGVLPDVLAAACPLGLRWQPSGWQLEPLWHDIAAPPLPRVLWATSGGRVVAVDIAEHALRIFFWAGVSRLHFYVPRGQEAPLSSFVKLTLYALVAPSESVDSLACQPPQCQNVYKGPVSDLPRFI
mmetsp:Transcript_14729/g.40163  ORF Transcript_14729/g.40163 Transcript_14729/m.40163 type:complete len:170 (-) Transcript_14729:40-549(-)